MVGSSQKVANLQLKKIVLNEIELPLKDAFETSFGVTTGRRVIIVQVIDKNGVSGYGECTAMEQPFYNEESVDTSWAVISGSIAPMLSSAAIANASDVGCALSPIKGNRMAISAVETAVWDLEAKEQNIPLWRHLGGSLPAINCGVSIGIQPTAELLVERVTRELESGYQRIKIKIKPGQDIALVKAVREKFPDILLSVDANSAYRLERDVDILKALDEFGLLMIEQPLEAGDILDHSKLQQLIRTPICLDESITCVRDARQAIDLGACRIINIKLGRVGGHAAAKEIQELAKAAGIPVWCGGMLETGVGRAHNIAMSTLDGFTLPGDVSASARYWERDIIEPPVTVNPNGTINAPDSAGIGFQVKQTDIQSLTTRTTTLQL